MAAIRIQLGDLPPMVGDMVVALLGGPPAAEIVGRCVAGDDPVAAARHSSADLLVVGKPSVAGPLSELIAVSQLAVLALPAAGSTENGRLIDVAGSDVRLDRGELGGLAERLTRGLIAPADAAGGAAG